MLLAITLSCTSHRQVCSIALHVCIDNASVHMVVCAHHKELLASIHSRGSPDNTCLVINT